MIASPHQADLLFYPSLHLYIRGCHLFLPGHRSHQQERVRRSFLRIRGRHSLPQARALKLSLIQQDSTSLDTAVRLYLYLPTQRDLQVLYPHSV